MRKIIKIMMAFIAILVVTAVGLGVYAYSYIKGISLNELINHTSAAPITVSGNEYTLDQDVVNILVLGVDYDKTRVGGGLRSDTMMLLSVNTKKNTAALISIPRDTRATVHKLNSGGSVSSTVTTKINAAFSYGASSESTSTFSNRAKNAIDAVETLLNHNGRFSINIDYYVIVDMDAIGPCVDAIGGVDVTLEDDMLNLNAPGYLGRKGDTIHLDGVKAESYVRVRKGGTLDGSDIGRAERQQNFVKAYLAKLKTTNLITTVPNLYNQLSKYLYTNMDFEKVVALGMILKDADLSNLTIKTIPGNSQTIDGLSYYIADRTKLDTLIADLFYNSATSNTKATATPTKSTTKATATPTKKVTATATPKKSSSVKVTTD